MVRAVLMTVGGTEGFREVMWEVVSGWTWGFDDGGGLMMTGLPWRFVFWERSGGRGKRLSVRAGKERSVLKGVFHFEMNYFRVIILVRPTKLG